MGDTAPEEGQSHRSAIRKLFEETRRRLVETGTRNRLVHVNRQSRRANVLDIINERSDDAYSILADGRRTMRFLATGRDKSDDSDTPSLAPVVDAEFDSDRYTDIQLEISAGVSTASGAPIGSTVEAPSWSV